MQQHTKLNNGFTISNIGLGTWKSNLNEVKDAVMYAITKAGYRHVDCASIYGNEKEVGEAFVESFNSVKREEIFITSKLWNTDHRPENVEKACRQSLSDLRLDYLDLYLMHWGIAFKHTGELEPLDKKGYAVLDSVSIRETWKAMEDLVKKDLVKSIGVANFTSVMIVDLLSCATISPVMNQIELHPYNSQEELIAFCKHNDIAVTAYSPLGHVGPQLFDEEVIKNLGKKYNKTSAQVLLNWAISRGTIVIPKSVNPGKIDENIHIFDFELTNEEIKEIDMLNKNKRFVDPFDWWKIPYFK